MTAAEADRYLDGYRELLKAWTMAISGFGAGNPTELYRMLEEGVSVLAQIALDFPDRAFSADTLMRSRSRTSYDFTGPPLRADVAS